MLPSGSVAWNLQFQALLASRFLSDVAVQALLYGALIATARGGGDELDAALLGAAYLLPGVVLALYGGALADALPKRIVLASTYLAMGLLCLLIPGLFGTGFLALLFVIFAVRALHQISQPSEASAVPLVANREELASATSFISFASSAGEVIGKALLAPLLVQAWGVDPVIILAGLLFFLSSSRVFKLETRPVRERRVEAEPAAVPARFSTRTALRYLFAEPGVLWMLLLAAMASTVNVVLGVLGPQYVQSVLNVEPANAVYVFAPAPIGLVIALGLAPLFIARSGERFVAAVGFGLVAVAGTALGLVQPLVDHFGWVLFFDIPGVGPRVEMAALMSIFLGVGMTFAAAAAQTFVTRNIPLEIQGRTNALLGMLKDGLAIPSLLLLGMVAGVVGVRTVITVAPALLLISALFVDNYSARWRVGASGNRFLRYRRTTAR
jgi:Na+/melibiose symporter-like transporter